MPSLGEVNIRIGAEISGLQRNIKKAQREVEQAARRMTQIGEGLTRSLTLPILAAGAASLKFATDFETSFTKINTLVGVTGSTLDEFRQGIDSISGEVGKSKKELADALFVITSAGQRGSSALETLAAASKASVVGLGETAEIARAAVAAVQAYGEENLRSAEAVDKLTAIVREGNLAAEELAPVIGKVLPVASQLGVSFDEVGANIATFTRLGVNAAGAVDGLRSLLSNIIKPSEQAKEELAKVGLTMDDVRASIKERGLAQTLQDLQNAFKGNTEALGRIFGDVQGLTNVLGTAGAQGEEYIKILESIKNTNGLVEESFKTASETAEVKMKKALVNLQNVAIDLGNVIVPVFTDLLSAITPLIQSLTRLPKPVQTAIVAFGAMAAASGPVLTVLGNMRLAVGSVGVAYKSVVGATTIGVNAFNAYREAATAAGLSVTRLTGVMPGLTAAWKALNTVAKASIIGLAITAVTGLAIAISQLTSNMSRAAQVQKTLNEVHNQAESQIAGERAEVLALGKVLSDNTAKYEEKKAALERLQAISPEYFQGLSLEKSSYQEINGQIQKYVANLLAAARAEAARSKIVELEKRRLELQEEINDILTQEVTVSNVLKEVLNQAIGNDFLARLQKAKKEIELIEEQQQKLAETFIQTAPKIAQAQEQIKATPATSTGIPARVLRRIKAGDLLPPAQDLASAVKEVAKHIEDNLNKELPALSLKVSDVTHPLTLLGEQFEIIEAKALAFGESFDPVAEKIKAIEAAMNSLLENGVSPYSASIDFLKEQHAALTEVFKSNEEKQKAMQASMEAFSEAGQAVGNAILTTSNEASASLAKMGQAALAAARQFIAAKIREFVAAQLVKGALSSGPFGLFLAPAIGAAAAAAFNAIISSLKIPAFAHGGLLTGPAFVLAGEGPNISSNNPEVIAPLDRLKSMLDGRVQEVVVTGRLSGHDLLISNERTAQRRERMRGF